MDVHIENVRVKRSGRTVLEISSLHFHARQTTAILGPNGAGKTTLLRLIAGLERSRTGEVRVPDDDDRCFKAGRGFTNRSMRPFAFTIDCC